MEIFNNNNNNKALISTSENCQKHSLVPLRQQISNGIRVVIENYSGLQEEQTEETRNEVLLGCVLYSGVERYVLIKVHFFIKQCVMCVFKQSERTARWICIVRPQVPPESRRTNPGVLVAAPVDC